ncbi:MAG: 16S rRNA (cytidine(1402)-2'-O)-methyltransferase [Acetobacter sp.]|nr:16S rRNA (cytidine(1402)-2'-O)-methyltransferase [Bacteroides sp.]MCM1341910.1 16S rRNA (cytidine(1402)-2'-O)-methyltransferase [Acetobacter sp.]MCM1434094.1 16S rRNA (cytidine(1402)-2'-O)-methyltransferase [Clostridiales bacterium]
MSGKLFVVGTPIGNLGDFSPRAVETLETVDFIAAEDTRVTLKLLNHFGIKKEMVSYFEHNKRERGEIICQRILNGENCAIVTDAGMPAISDPGQDLVSLCHELGITVESVPGPTAFATALAISGMNSGRFTFEGFLSVNKKSRREHLEDIKEEKRTLIFYEAPHKLPYTLKDLYNVLGDRKLAIVREITKLHEEVINTTLKSASQDYTNGSLKGEIVLIIEGKIQEAETELTFDDAVNMARSLVEKGMSVNNASKEIASQTPFKKGDIYKALI